MSVVEEAESKSRPGLPRSAVAAVLAVAVGAIIVLLSSRPTWIRVALKASTGQVQLNGGSAGAAAVPLALVAVAGLIALALVRTWLRRVLAVLILAAGVGVLAAAAHVLAGPDAIARGNSRVRAAGELGSAHLAAAPYTCALGGLLIMVGAVLAGVFGGRWPGPSQRYEAVGGDRQAKSQASRPADAWEALERGDDPTKG